MVNKKSLATFVRTVGNQVIAGFKHFLNNVKISGDLIHDPDPLGSTATNLLTVDAQGVIRKATSLAGATGTVTSVALTAPSAFTVTGSPITTSGTIAIGAAGTAAQYVRGDGQLGDFPTSGGGGSSVSYYLNGSVNQGTFGGNVYREFNKTPIVGAGTDFTIAADGYIAQFITDANDPSLLEIPGGNWNVEFWFSASSSGGTPSFYVELSKYDGTTFTAIANNSATPEFIAFGTTISQYYTALAVPQTTLAVTDRLALRIYVIHSGRTITLHTEDNHLCQVITTFSTGLNALNGLTKQVQYFATGTSGTNFNISSVGDTHTFNIPTASGSNRGLLSTSDWTNFTAAYNDKINSAAVTGTTTKTLTLTQQDGGTITASWTDINTDAVTSVFGRTGAVIAVSGDYNTSQVTENTNLYFTNARARTAISLTTTGTSGAATYDNATGVLNVPQYQSVLTNPVTGTGTTNYVTKWTSASAVGNSQIFDNGTNVGIGTTSPSYKLDVNGGFRVDGTNGDFIVDPNGNDIYFTRNGTNYFYGTQASSSFAFYTNSNLGLFQSSAGDVGIATTSPGTKLDVTGIARATSLSTVSGLGLNVAGYAYLSQSLFGVMTFLGHNVRASDSVANTAIVQNGSWISSLIKLYYNEGITFHTDTTVYAAGATYPLSTTERMRIQTNGNVGIGTTSVFSRFTVSGALTASSSQISIVNTEGGHAIIRAGIAGINNNGMSFVTANVDGSSQNVQMVINASGSVGIGTTSPAAPLHIASSSGVIFGATTGAIGTSQITTASAGSPVSSRFAFGTDGSGWQYRIAKNTAGTIADLVTVADSGNVGIGTTSPAYPLDIVGFANSSSGFRATNGTVDNRISWSSGNVGFLGTISNHPIALNTNATERMRITEAGNVGIGTTNPGHLLDVAGTGRFIQTTATPLTVYRTSVSSNVGIRFQNDTTSWYAGLAADDAFGISFNNANLSAGQVKITTTGNVGIGTTSPGASLHVAGAISSAPTGDGFLAGIQSGYAVIHLNGSAATGSLIDFSVSGTDTKGRILYENTNNYFGFNTNGSERLRITSTGDVGIGTTSPSQKLHVSGSARITGAIYDSANSAGTSGQILSSTATGTSWIAAPSGGGVTGTGSANRIAYWSSGSNLTFDSNLYWDNTNSRLGIGTTAPSAKVHLVEGTFVTRFLVGQSTFTGYNSGLTAGQKGNIIVGQSNTFNNAYVINFIYQGSTSTSNAIGLGFFNNDDIVVITAGKSVGIATNSPNTSYTTTIASVVGKTGVLLAQGSVKIDGGALGVGVNASATAGRIDASNDIVPFSSSDLKLKENVKNIKNPIEKVKKLNGIEFDWIKELEEHHGYSGHDTGVIAQEVQDVLPTAVRTNASGYLAVRYEKLIGLLIEAVKEQQAEIDYLKSKI